METTIKLKAAELTPGLIEAIRLLAQGDPGAEVTITVRPSGAPRPVTTVAKNAHLGSATPGEFSANYLSAPNDDEEDDISDPFGDMTKILK
jgi:hypothetical protein